MLRTWVARARATRAAASTGVLPNGVTHRPLPLTAVRLVAFAFTGRGAGSEVSATAGGAIGRGFPPPRRGVGGQPVWGGAGGRGRSTTWGRGGFGATRCGAGFGLGDAVGDGSAAGTTTCSATGEVGVTVMALVAPASSTAAAATPTSRSRPVSPCTCAPYVPCGLKGNREWT